MLGAAVVPAVGWLARVEIEGEENLPESGPFVLSPNHCSELDPLVVAVVVWRLGRAPRFMTKDSLFRIPVVGAILRRTGMIPVARASSSAAARHTMDAAEQLVTHGRGVIVYPEGTLTRDPGLWPMRGKTGAVRLAMAGDIPLIPMAHWGVQEILPRYGKISLWPPRKRVRVVIGAPVDPSAFGEKTQSPSTLTAGTAMLMDEIAGLLGTLRGETPPAERWNPASHNQKETGRFES